MAGINHPSLLKTMIFVGCAALLLSSTAQAQKKLKPGSTCELQTKITVRNKAQRKNVKTRKLTEGTKIKIVRYHRVWVRVETQQGIAFATPKSIRKHCKEAAPDSVVATQVEATPPAPAPALQAKDSPPLTKPVDSKPPTQAPPAKSQEDSTSVPAPNPSAPAAEISEPKAQPPQVETLVPGQTVQVPDLSLPVTRPDTAISPAAWVALGFGAASMGASAYFVTQLTTQDEATTGQAALLTGTAGIIGIIIGLSYVLSPEEVISKPSSGSDAPISATISVGPGSIGLSGQF